MAINLKKITEARVTFTGPIARPCLKFNHAGDKYHIWLRKNDFGKWQTEGWLYKNEPTAADVRQLNPTNKLNAPVLNYIKRELVDFETIDAGVEKVRAADEAQRKVESLERHRKRIVRLRGALAKYSTMFSKVLTDGEVFNLYKALQEADEGVDQ